MAKKSSIEKNNRRRKLVARDLKKRDALKAVISNRETALDERVQAVMKLAEMPRNGAKIRIRNRCEVTGRPRAYYRKLKMSRIALRELGNLGLVPGLVKSSW
jgi:small subunit ribosomal protein S14